VAGNNKARSDVSPATGPDVLSVMAAEFRPALIRYFSRRVNNKCEVEDLVHDVLARLAHSGSLSNVRNEQGYVFQTANSVLVDWMRKCATHRAAAHHRFDPEEHGGEDFAPDRVLLGREALRRATAILLELPERTRTIFVLRRLEGMGHAEIASRLGVSVSTVEKQMCLALAHLAERMERP
jgi:RNA polymerase sigma-70 factor (ECF subfamily)